MKRSNFLPRICSTAFLIAAACSVLAESDDEWRKRVGLDPAAINKIEIKSPEQVNGLILWLDPDKNITSDKDGLVSSWGDATGKSLSTLAQEKEERKPLLIQNALNGHPALRFGAALKLTDGTGTCLHDSNFTFGNSNSFSIFVVARSREPKFVGYILSYEGYSGKNFTLHDNIDKGPGFSMDCKIGEANNQVRINEEGTLFAGQGFKILEVVADSDAKTVKFYKNGILIGKDEKPFDLAPKQDLCIGARGMQYSWFANCDIAEVIVFNRPLLPEERIGIEKSLIAKYGFSEKYITSLADRLPYAYYPSSNELEIAFDIDSPFLKEFFTDKLREPVKIENAEPGISYAAYGPNININFVYQAHLPDFTKIKPVNSGVHRNITTENPPDGKIFESQPTNAGAVIFKGFIDIPKDGTYTFFLRPYANSKLIISDKVVVDDVLVTVNDRGGSIALKAGKHPIVLAGLTGYRPVEVPEQLVYVSGPGLEKQPLPEKWLSHVAETEFTVPQLIFPEKPLPPPEKLKGVKEITVRVVPLPKGKPVIEKSIRLDGSGRGQEKFAIPDLKDGEYAVEYIVAGEMVRSPVTLKRYHYPFEKNEMGLEHKIYPPFEPIQVEKDKLAVVDRTYDFNAYGTLDSVVSKGRELLAEPVRLVVETDKGILEFKEDKIAGKVLYPDLAVFEGALSSDSLKLKTKSEIEEDGCIKVQWEFLPGSQPALINKMYMDIVFKDEAAPLFHFSGNDSMRHNYAGKTPRGGKISWSSDYDPQGWVPCIWKAEGPDADGEIWNSTKIQHWSHGNTDNFCPYIWLGAEERGLAWFGWDERGYSNDLSQPVQSVIREKGKVIIRINFISRPAASSEPRKILFGLQASPTKPLRKDWREHHVPGGGGLAVHCWGGYICSDKYPDNRDFSIVDKIQEARRTGKVDEEFFKKKDEQRAWKDMKIHFDGPWLNDVGMFAGHAANQANMKGANTSAIYFEEHCINNRKPEYHVFQDEWSTNEFNRFQPKGDHHWRTFPRSYTDFAAYFANEWMKRGVSIYFDNADFDVQWNPYVNGYVGRMVTLWDQRLYYKRMWKLLAKYNTEGSTEYPIDFTMHITNTQNIPMNTWATATLDLEQPYRIDKSRKPRTAPADDGSWMSKGEGFRLPFPPDYTRTMTLSRTVGAIPHAMFPLPNWGDYRDQSSKNWTDKMKLSDWGMYWVHEIRRNDYGTNICTKYAEFMSIFGYGRPEVNVHNYWNDKPFAGTDDPEVVWLAMTRDQKPFGMILLQSYKENPAKTKVRFPGAKVLMDVYDRTRYQSVNGEFHIEMPGDYGTRLFLAAENEEDLPSLNLTPDVIAADDFEYGVMPSFNLARHTNICIAEDADRKGNHVLRIGPVHPGHQFLSLDEKLGEQNGDGELSFKFRIPKVPDKQGRCGIFHLLTRYMVPWPKNSDYDLRFEIDIPPPGGTPCFLFNYLPFKDGKQETFTDIKTDLRGKPLTDILAPDTKWHTVLVSMKGKHQILKIDDKIIFEGDSDASLAGKFHLSSGWGLWDIPDFFVEFDDVMLKK